MSDSLAAILAVVREFSARPTPQAEAALRERRAEFARDFLERPADRLHAMATEASRKELAELLDWGLQSLPLDSREREVIAGADRLFLEPRNRDSQLRAILAASLFRSPHRLPGLCDLSAIDASLHPLLVTALYAEPRFFVAIGDAQAHLEWMERITAEIRAFVEGEEPAAARRSLAEAFARHGRFAMTYFNESNLLPLARSRARVIEAWLDLFDAGRDYHFAARPGGRTKLRLGLLRNLWSESAEAASCLAHLNGLDRDRFEILLYVSSSDDNPVEVAAKRRADRFVVLDESPYRACAQIRDDDLDILLIGANVTAIANFTAILSAFRLARTQISLTLSPTTSGFASIDRYLTGELNEPPEAQQEYAERLLFVPGSINRYDFDGGTRPAATTVSRAELRIPEDCFVYASGASRVKLIPELVDAWAQILSATPDSRLLLYPFNPNWSRRFPITLFALHLRRFLAERGIDWHRIKLAPPQPTRAHVQALVRTADLYLDSFPYSGAVSICDPLSVGCPVLARRGRPARARQSAAMLADLGVPEMVVSTPREYIAEAIALHRDRSRLAGLKARAEIARTRATRLATVDLSVALLRA